MLNLQSDSLPTTLVEYLTSIGKASWYGRFVASSGLAPNSDGSGGTVADGGAVGYWSPVQQLSFNYNFIQPTAAKRPAYGASRDGVPAVYGDALSWTMYLNSTSALNGPYTTLFSMWLPSPTGFAYSHNGTSNCYRILSANPDYIMVTGSHINTNPQASRKGLSGANNRVRVGWITTATSHNGFAPFLLSRAGTSDWVAGSMMEMAFCPTLTTIEIATALNYLP